MRRRPPSIRRLPLLALLAAGALAVGACTVNPATGERQLTLVSESQAIQLGRDADKEITASMGLYPDEGLQAYVRNLGERLAASSERPGLPWEFKVVDDPVVNAFALPGGFIYVTRGILAHFNSEAELVSVLGHEIGHVTGRHGVERLSKAQLAGVGLGVAAIASPEFREYAGLAETGLGLLFLKFSRDDERQADDLGFRYLVGNGYDPDEMPKVFITLDRVSSAHGAGSLPGWLSTHPAPANRVQRLQARIEELPSSERQGRVNRDSYLAKLDGVVYGEDPREGFFKGPAFYHPELAFQLRFPDGWQTSNQRQAVGAVSPRQDAIVVLSLSQESSPNAAAQAFFNQSRVERGSALRSGVYNFRAGQTTSTSQAYQGLAAFFEQGGRVYRILGYSTESQWSRYRDEAASTIASFRRLTDRRYLNVEPARLDVVTLPRAMTLREFAQAYPSTADTATLAIINGVDEGTRLESGRRVKRVVGGKLP